MALSNAVIAPLPALGAICGIVTIGWVYHLTAVSGHLPEGIATPPISFLGLKSPEHEVYQIGFSITGGFLLCLVHFWRQRFYPILQREFPEQSKYALYGGYAAGIGVIGQGIITLEEDLLEKLDAQGEQFIICVLRLLNEFSMNTESPNMQSIVHQCIAGIFFLGAAAHCYSTVYMYFKSESQATERMRQSKWLKAMAVVCSVISSPVAQVMHPAATGSKRAADFAIAGMAQYLAVGSYLLFFATYSVDFALCTHCKTHRGDDGPSYSGNSSNSQAAAIAPMKGQNAYKRRGFSAGEKP
jgi:hypothetical protein